jgi:hypothetical protein
VIHFSVIVPLFTTLCNWLPAYMYVWHR